MKTVAEVMATTLLTVDPSATVAEVATAMLDRQVGSAVVMEGETLVGIFTERDALSVFNHEYTAAGRHVSECMTHDPVTITSDTPTADALHLMLDHRFRHLPVVDDGDVVGMVSIRDLSGAIGRMHSAADDAGSA